MSKLAIALLVAGSLAAQQVQFAPPQYAFPEEFEELADESSFEESLPDDELVLLEDEVVAEIESESESPSEVQ
jgi:hypothetical protein